MYLTAKWLEVQGGGLDFVGVRIGRGPLRQAVAGAGEPGFPGSPSGGGRRFGKVAGAVRCRRRVHRGDDPPADDADGRQAPVHPP